jgi:hypothetical protein
VKAVVYKFASITILTPWDNGFNAAMRQVSLPSFQYSPEVTEEKRNRIACAKSKSQT